MPKKKTSKPKMTKAERKSMGKYAHKKTEIDGIIFDSKMEADYYEYLKAEMKAGRIAKFDRQPPFILQDKFIVVDGQIIHGSDKDFEKIKRKSKVPTVKAISYISDFDVTYADGTRVIIDVKGKETADFKLKKKMFQYRYPELTLQLVIWDTTTKQWMDYEEHKKIVRERKKANKAKKEAI